MAKKAEGAPKTPEGAARKLASQEESAKAGLWMMRNRMGIEWLRRESPAPCSSVHDSPCEASDPHVVYWYKWRELGRGLTLLDDRRTFCPCGRTEYFEENRDRWKAG